MKTESVRDMFGDEISVSVEPDGLYVSAQSCRSLKRLDYMFTPGRARLLASILTKAAAAAEESSELLSD